MIWAISDRRTRRLVILDQSGQYHSGERKTGQAGSLYPNSLESIEVRLQPTPSNSDSRPVNIGNIGNIDNIHPALKANKLRLLVIFALAKIKKSSSSFEGRTAREI